MPLPAPMPTPDPAPLPGTGPAPLPPIPNVVINEPRLHEAAPDLTKRPRHAAAVSFDDDAT
jgi:hypothetical protein